MILVSAGTLCLVTLLDVTTVQIQDRVCAFLQLGLVSSKLLLVRCTQQQMVRLSASYSLLTHVARSHQCTS
jgi:hypothetical protein